MPDIPKKIHCCWFGGKPLPKSALKCIRSWEKFFPDYEIIQWNESNFDVSCNDYVSEAYNAKKYAFVSDYARFKIMYDFGGVYFDTDVEVIKDMTEIIAVGPYMGAECIQSHEGKDSLRVNPGLGFAAFPGMSFLKNMIEQYDNMNFVDSAGRLNLTTIVTHTSRELEKSGLIAENSIQNCGGFTIYPPDYFNPKDMMTRKICLTENTYSIHHFDSSWHTPYEKFKRRIIALIGSDFTKAYVKLKHSLTK